jgi:hypothetical protein
LAKSERHSPIGRTTGRVSKYDSQYYFILADQDERIPSMTPDEDTSRKPFTSEQLPLHTKPLIFHNGSLDYQKRHRIAPMDPPPDLLFGGSDILVKDALREKLLPMEIPNLAIQPAIYIDHKNNWHEDYWYLTFIELFDCWDRDHSSFRPKPIDFDDGVLLYNVHEYSLNEELLDRTPLESRRLFKMGSTLDGFVVAHVSVAKHFRLSGAVLVPIAEYGVSFP